MSLQQLNKKVGKSLASGLDTAVDASETTKAKVCTSRWPYLIHRLQTHPFPSRATCEHSLTLRFIASTTTSGSGKATETADSARQTANHALGSAAGKARDAKDEVTKQM